MICTPTKYYSGNQIDKNEMGGAFRTYWGTEEVHLAQDRDSGRELAYAVMILWQNAGNYLPSYKPVSFPRRILLHGVNNAEIDHMKLEIRFPPH